MTLTVLYLYVFFGPAAAAGYIEAMLDPVRYYGRNPGMELIALQREARRLALVFGPLVLAGLAAPELMLPAALFLYPPLRMGLFTLHPAQQYVRFLAPALFMAQLAAVVGVARLLLKSKTKPPLSWLAWSSLAACAAASVVYVAMTLSLPSRVAISEVRGLRESLEAIGEAEPVLAFRAVLPNLSCRTELYDYYQLPPAMRVEEAAARCNWAVVELRQYDLLNYLLAEHKFEITSKFESIAVLRKTGWH